MIRCARLLSTAYAERGIAISNARDRLQGYLQVENTYLSTFQILGGFGLLLGTLGLAVVLLRNVWERRREFALLRAVGYRRRNLGGLVLAENAALVLFGLCAGVGSALIAVAPQAAGGSTPWARLSGLLALVVAAGLAAGLIGLRATVRALSRCRTARRMNRHSHVISTKSVFIVGSSSSHEHTSILGVCISVKSDWLRQHPEVGIVWFLR